MIKVVIVDDSSDLREGLQIALKEHDDEFICIGAFSDAESAVKNVETLLPDVILMDINFLEMQFRNIKHTLIERSHFRN